MCRIDNGHLVTTSVSEDAPERLGGGWDSGTTGSAWPVSGFCYLVCGVLEHVGLFPGWMAFWLVSREQLLMGTPPPQCPGEQSFRCWIPQEALVPCGFIGHVNGRSLSSLA